MSTFKIVAVQTAPIFMDREATVAKACELIAKAAQDDDVRLVVFPEAFIPTYSDWVWRIPPGEHQMLTDGSRGEGLVYSGHTEEEKQALAQEITRVVHETIGAPVEYIYVLIRETPGSHHIKAGEALGDYAPESGRS